MALSESGLQASGVRLGPMAVVGPGGRKMTVRARKGPARGSTAVRKGGKQSFYKAPRRGRKH